MEDFVVYFSLNNKRKQSFYRYIKNEGICYRPKFSFNLEGEDEEFDDPRDLIPMIERKQKKDSLHIIIDFVSLCVEGKERNYSAVVRDIIVCYPEVQFLFDETFVIKENNGSNKEEPEFGFLNFLFWSGTKDANMKLVMSEFHRFNLGDFSEKTIERQFILMLKGRNNMFDASNLRYVLKKKKLDDLHVDHNYQKLEESRSKYAAVVVEEEYHQNVFNGYCLYANGFRVFTIMTASELRWINEESPQKYLTTEDKEKKIKPLLVRDYDLQFLDEDKVPKTDENKNEIDFIRKASFDKESSSFTVLPQEGNPYWKSFDDDSTYFVSKGDSNIKVKLKYKSEAMGTSSKAKKLKLRGVKKPLEGIYAKSQLIHEVKSRYNDSRDQEPFKTNRKGGDHSCPLAIYGIARSMVNRSESYYYNGRHRLAALVAGEALELLNGFHKSLMNRAYYIQAVSENAMAMSLLGGNEKLLKKDVNIRLRKKVKTDVKRMIIDVKDRYNLFYNIFNDCMLFCQEKEYFKAADEALCVMVQEKEGLDLFGWFNLIRKWVNKI